MCVNLIIDYWDSLIVTGNVRLGLLFGGYFALGFSLGLLFGRRRVRLGVGWCVTLAISWRINLSICFSLYLSLALSRAVSRWLLLSLAVCWGVDLIPSHVCLIVNRSLVLHCRLAVSLRFHLTIYWLGRILSLVVYCGLWLAISRGRSLIVNQDLRVVIRLRFSLAIG